MKVGGIPHRTIWLQPDDSGCRREIPIEERGGEEGHAIEGWHGGR